MNIIIFGGSFNPIHYGHIGLGRWVLEHTETDEIWFMVSPNNPLKDASILADEAERFRGVKCAVEENNMSMPNGKVLRASDFEFYLPRPSYTANTLRELQKAYPEHRFSLLIGEDNWEIFSRWREYEFILANFPIYVYPRHSKRVNEAFGPLPYGSVTYLKDAPYYDISSTEIREKQKK